MFFFVQREAKVLISLLYRFLEFFRVYFLSGDDHETEKYADIGMGSDNHFMCDYHLFFGRVLK